jgi:hypothetical protein
MLGDDELNKFMSMSDKYGGYKTLLSGAKTPNFSLVSTPDTNSDQSDLGKLLNPDVSSMDTEALLNNVIAGFASSFSGLGGAGGIKIDNSNIEGDGSSGDIISDLINLLIGIVQIPIRFAFMAKSLGEATGSLAVGIGGLTQSIALGTKDLYMLTIAILQIFFKYITCLFSFVLTTFGGCFLVHPITLFFTMLYLFIMYLLDKVKGFSGLDLSPPVDSALDSILSVGFISFIRSYCYSCFGVSVSLGEILSDVGVIQDIGNTISYDFNNTMPRYMKPAMPLGKASLDSLDKAIN